VFLAQCLKSGGVVGLSREGSHWGSRRRGVYVTSVCQKRGSTIMMCRVYFSLYAREGTQGKRAASNGSGACGL